MPTLKFKNVQKSFGDFQALKNISFEVKKGEFFALLGPNGAGKTTLINCLNGISNRDSGEIWVNGKDPEKDPVFTKSALGIVEQEITADPFFSPIEILKIRRGLFGMRADNAYLEWILEKLHLTDKKNVKSRALSGGMKRRLMIAKALAHDPEIIILDEPTAGVDIQLRQDLYKFLQELREKKGKTILLTTHYLEEAELLASRVAIQKNGEIVICEDTKKLLKSQKRILELKKFNGETIEIEESADGFNLQKIVEKYPCVKDLKIKEPKLEDIFLKLTKK